MYLKTFPSGPFQTNTYLIGDEKAKLAVVVDPAKDVCEKLLPLVQKENWLIQAIWLTHSHWDHIADVKRLKEIGKVPVFVHPLDAPNVKNPGADGLACWIDIDPVEEVSFFQEGDLLSVSHFQFEVIHTPGHTPGGVCFYCSFANTLLSGDTLFQGSIGNLSFPSADAKQMWLSLDKLAKLPKETVVFPGHGPSTTIEKEMNLLKNARTIFG